MKKLVITFRKNSKPYKKDTYLDRLFSYDILNISYGVGDSIYEYENGVFVCRKRTNNEDSSGLRFSMPIYNFEADLIKDILNTYLGILYSGSKIKFNKNLENQSIILFKEVVSVFSSFESISKNIEDLIDDYVLYTVMVSNLHVKEGFMYSKYTISKRIVENIALPKKDFEMLMKGLGSSGLKQFKLELNKVDECYYHLIFSILKCRPHPVLYKHIVYNITQLLEN